MSEFSVYYIEVKSGVIKRELSHELRVRVASLHTGIPPERFECGVGKRGKPYFKSHPELHFSVSHSGSFWVCAFADFEVGCDIQQIRIGDTPERLRRIAKRWFSASEFESFAVGESAHEFYRIWARKEAYVKLTGTGITDSFPDPPTDCVIRPLPAPYGYAAAIAMGDEEGRGGRAF